MFLMNRLVARSSRSLATMIGAAQAGDGRGWEHRPRSRYAASALAEHLPSPPPSTQSPRLTS